MTITLIAACDLNLGIGYKNELLVKLPNDMEQFKKKTTGNFVVMGRLTYESIGKPLPKRTNIVLSRDKNYDPHPSVYVYSSIKDVLHEYYSYSEGQAELYVCGGSQIYKDFLPYADKVILTIIENKFQNVDSYFPRLPDVFVPVSREEYKADEENIYNHHIVTYEKK